MIDEWKITHKRLKTSMPQCKAGRTTIKIVCNRLVLLLRIPILRKFLTDQI